ncbi:MAG: uroporphyrin-III C/tetrapyrrole methyltransferase [Candidatus Aramenus sulfurataquae]|uniref:Uroporphyrin-III C/tetrapyrrole methyltransferase n=1 Tax=Candidatus Aramenus sulfurataquae TaxID=1326980 RepID=W7KZG3_9CREN|nr:MAG: uroporphyrin-III C/tetrapyrrole methyltransferase [Candidatus Aramenus sulfurataquae]
MIKVVGIGAGGKTLTLAAIEALREAEIVIGYSKYVEMVKEYLNPNAVVIESEVHEIEKRVLASLEFKDKRVVVLSSGDPMVYGMGSRMYNLDVEVIPGVTAALLASSVAKVPLDDFVTISLSTYSRSLEEIRRKIETSIVAGFTIVLYNVNPRVRRDSAKMVEEVLKEMARDWEFYLVRYAWKENQSVTRGKVAKLNINNVDMDSILIVKKW